MTSRHFGISNRPASSGERIQAGSRMRDTQRNLSDGEQELMMMDDHDIRALKFALGVSLPLIAAACVLFYFGMPS